MLKKIENYLNWLIYNKPLPKEKTKKKVNRKAYAVTAAVRSTFGNEYPIKRIWFDTAAKTVKLHAYGRGSYFYLPTGGFDMYSHWLIDYTDTNTLPDNETIYKLMGVGIKRPNDELIQTGSINVGWGDAMWGEPTASFIPRGSSGTAGSSGTSGYKPKETYNGIPIDRINEELLKRSPKLSRELLPDNLPKTHTIIKAPNPIAIRQVEPIPSPVSEETAARIEKLKKLAGIRDIISKPPNRNIW